jgi:hypothetical protein
MSGLKIMYDNDESADLIKMALSAEKKRLEIGLAKTEREIKNLEKRYQVSSEIFLAQLAAEDLEGGDEEYVRWAGEIEIRDRILQRLRKLDDVEYVAH